MSDSRDRFVDYAPFSLLAIALLVAVGHLMWAAHADETHSAEKTRVRLANHAILDEIGREMRTAVRVFERSTTSGEPSWLTRIGFPRSARPLRSSCLPRLAKALGFGPETTSASRTGNAVLFAKPDKDVVFLAGAETWRIPTYRLVCYYLTAVGEGPREGAPDGLGLARFVSVPVLDADALELACRSATAGSKVTGGPDTSVWRALTAASTPPGTSKGAVSWAWRRGSRRVSGLLRIDAKAGALVAAAPGQVLAADRGRSSDGLLTFSGHSIATNYAAPIYGVASLGRRDLSGGGFPHGFEVQIAGSSSTRRVLIHTSLVAGDSPDAEGSDDRSIVIVRDS